MGNFIGVAAEYNPFHKGHGYHLEQSRALAGGGTVICVMSGDFVQRGEAAVFAKHARAEAAVRGGADLVLELPLPWALSSAEGFARGCVGLLASLGIVTHMSFGTESGTLAPLLSAAEALLDPAVDAQIREELDSGISYAAARQRALARRGAALAGAVETPNNILAVEYLKAMYALGVHMEPLAIPRRGAGHDRISAPGESYPSASELRTMLASGRDAFRGMPPAAVEVFRREMERGRGPVTAESLETAVLSRLRMLPTSAYNELPDASEGLGNRLSRAVRTEATLDGVLAAARTKRYTLSRLRRMLLCAALGLGAGMAEGLPLYARVLAANEAGLEALRQIGEHGRVPVIAKPAAARELDTEAAALFARNAAATDLYVLGYAAREERRAGADWRESPRIVRDQEA